ncbi:hypothetical protein GPECTOR_75g771 [Gonium pectorale]|uniref:Uncharacterized protein n=1 Tax=Gonium pectorale TaxID=33097 RepID=A0A150G2H2_GONPE|nr:hypothetical protein GPECTOR_75g771 [Gonium pectorale]|eukprot:KXZ44047.1 hypothetical protein GPECTOR_75g771 [Gonium pectorale]
MPAGLATPAAEPPADRQTVAAGRPEDVHLQIPLASPLMVLNPAYSPASSSVTASPHANAVGSSGSPHGPDGDGLRLQPAAGASLGQDSNDGAETPTLHSMPAAAWTAPLVQQAATPSAGSSGVAPSSGQDGSPTSQQAAHAAALLRSANDAVDCARNAVQRGDTEWLARVTSTLQAVQSAIEALREF